MTVPHSNRRLLLALLFGVSLAGGGCLATAEYETTIGEPTTGAVIENVSVYDINDIDGARYELDYRLPNRTGSYQIEAYERTNGSNKRISSGGRLGPEPTYKNELPPPWNDGDERTYELRVVQTDSETVVDSVTITVRRVDGSGLF